MKIRCIFLHPSGEIIEKRTDRHDWTLQLGGIYSLSKVYTEPRTLERIAIFRIGNPHPIGAPNDTRTQKDFAEKIFEEALMKKLTRLGKFAQIPKIILYAALFAFVIIVLIAR